jgi:hypothetical protein
MNSWLDRHGIECLDGKVRRLARKDPPRYNVKNPFALHKHGQNLEMAYVNRFT